MSGHQFLLIINLASDSQTEHFHFIFNCQTHDQNSLWDPIFQLSKRTASPHEGRRKGVKRELGNGNSHKRSSRTRKPAAVNTTLEINLEWITIPVMTISCLRLVPEMPRGANILRKIVKMSLRVLSDQQKLTEFQKNQFLLAWMLTEGPGHHSCDAVGLSEHRSTAQPARAGRHHLFYFLQKDRVFCHSNSSTSLGRTFHLHQCNKNNRGSFFF